MTPISLLWQIRVDRLAEPGRIHNSIGGLISGIACPCGRATTWQMGRSATSRQANACRHPFLRAGEPGQSWQRAHAPGKVLG